MTEPTRIDPAKQPAAAKPAIVPAAPFKPIIRSPHTPETKRVLILVQGPPGQGKTWFACSWPNPFALVFDPNTSTHDRLGVPYAIVQSWDEVERYWLRALEQRRISELVRPLQAADGSYPYANYTVETLILDSLTFFLNGNIIELGRGATQEMGPQGWDSYYARIHRFMRAASQAKSPDPRRPGAETYHLVATIHEDIKTTGEKGEYQTVVPSIQGKMAGHLAAFFDGHYLTERRTEGGEWKYYLRTRPSRQTAPGRGKLQVLSTRDCKGDQVIGADKMPPLLPNNYKAFAEVWGWKDKS